MPFNSTPLRSIDIAFETIDRDHARITFTIKNRKKVNEFLENKELQEFLTSPYTEEATTRGCRLIITRDETANTLNIGRYLGRSTFKETANRDIVASILNYIMPYTTESMSDIGDFAAIGVSLSSPHQFNPEAFITAVVERRPTPGTHFMIWERGEPFKIDHITAQKEVQLKTELKQAGGLARFLPLFSIETVGIVSDYMGISERETIDGVSDTRLVSESARVDEDSKAEAGTEKPKA